MTNPIAESSVCLEIDKRTNRHRVLVRYDPATEPLPHVTLSSPNTIFVNDDDDNGNGTNYVFNPCCVVNNGPEARFQLYCLPSDYPAQNIVWSCTNPHVGFPCGKTGSNRLVALNLCLEQGGMSPSSTNEVLRIRNQLLALPPGTMQMLPTNQFYNVED